MKTTLWHVILGRESRCDAWDGGTWFGGWMLSSCGKPAVCRGLSESGKWASVCEEHKRIALGWKPFPTRWQMFLKWVRGL